MRLSLNKIIILLLSVFLLWGILGYSQAQEPAIPGNQNSSLRILLPLTPLESYVYEQIQRLPMRKLLQQATASPPLLPLTPLEYYVNRLMKEWPLAEMIEEAFSEREPIPEVAQAPASGPATPKTETAEPDNDFSDFMNSFEVPVYEYEAQHDPAPTPDQEGTPEGDPVEQPTELLAEVETPTHTRAVEESPAKTLKEPQGITEETFMEPSSPTPERQTQLAPLLSEEASRTDSLAAPIPLEPKTPKLQSETVQAEIVESLPHVPKDTTQGMAQEFVTQETPQAEMVPEEALTIETPQQVTPKVAVPEEAVTLEIPQVAPPEEALTFETPSAEPFVAEPFEDSLQAPSPDSDASSFEEKEVAALSQAQPNRFSKSLVEPPHYLLQQYANAEDFRDPFFLVRGLRKDSGVIQEPGTTVDGIRFQAQSGSDGFVERLYQQSNFSIEKIFGTTDRHESTQGCIHCHAGIEEISANHRFECTTCHAGNSKSKQLPKAHTNLVSNPSDLNHVDKFCGKCHANQIEQLKRSPMATAKNIINQTRIAWGSQSVEDPEFSLLPRPDQQGFGETEKPALVDGFLRTKCLRCHLNSPSPHRAGEYRATGCAACHMVYKNDGKSFSQDLAIQMRQNKESKKHSNRFASGYTSNSLKNSRGYPVLHKFTVAVPSVQCEHCHNHNGPGNEFEGLFRKPARPIPSLDKVESDSPRLYGARHELLLPDIHRERGMHCVDCHITTDVSIQSSKKGKKSIPKTHAFKTLQCETCHGTHSKAPRSLTLDPDNKLLEETLKTIHLNPNLEKVVKAGDSILANDDGHGVPHVIWEKNKWVLYSKVSGKAHTLPLLKNTRMPLAHKVRGHMKNMECATCHARWSASEWGLHAIGENDPVSEMWNDWSFSDPALQQLLRDKAKAVNDPLFSGTMLDWLGARSTANGIEGEQLDGVWWNVISDAGWKDMILGKNKRGKYSILKPRYQYFVTLRDGVGQLPPARAQVPLTMDGEPGFNVLPHTPHTIRKTARTCESCHENNVAIGLGDPLLKRVENAKLFLDELNTGNRLLPEFQLKQMVTEEGAPIQNSRAASQQARFLNAKEIKQLMTPSKAYKAYRYFDLKSAGFLKYLDRDSFPFDSQHQDNLLNLEAPRKEEDLLYSLDMHKFVKPPKAEIPPLPEVEPLFQPQAEVSPGVDSFINEQSVPESAGQEMDFMDMPPLENSFSQPEVSTSEQSVVNGQNAVESAGQKLEYPDSVPIEDPFTQPEPEVIPSTAPYHYGGNDFHR